MNRVVLSAHLIERGPLRYTPAGLAACDFVLKHASELSEAGQTRQVSMEIRGIAFGETAQALYGQPVGHAAIYTGFLTHQRSGRGVLLHVTQFD